MDYRPRKVDAELATYLEIFGAVQIDGPKWCGKTWAGIHQSKSVFEVANPAGNFKNREIAKLDPYETLTGEQPHLIDEWQEVPSIRDAVRHDVDKTGSKGSYILTGSSAPDDSATIHSGTGRIGRLSMTTMTMQELGLSDGLISLDKLFNSSYKIPIKGGDLTLNDVATIVARGGWPAMIDTPTELVLEANRSYLNNIADVDLTKIDGVKRNPNKVNALLRSLARNVATYVSNETIRQDIGNYNDESLTVQLIGEYLNLLSRIFIFTELPSWYPALKSPVRLRQAPKRYLFEPSLTVAALGADPKSLAGDTKLLGNIFESLVLHDLQVYVDAMDAKLYQYHDNANLEADAIIEKRNGDWGAMEIKLGYYHEDDAANNLLRLRDKMVNAQQKPLEFLAIVIGVGGISKRRDDGVVVVPIDKLGA
jgi:predicted AAA+ superfamily ATPase